MDFTNLNSGINSSVFFKPKNTRLKDLRFQDSMNTLAKTNPELAAFESSWRASNPLLTMPGADQKIDWGATAAASVPALGAGLDMFSGKTALFGSGTDKTLFKAKDAKTADIGNAAAGLGIAAAGMAGNIGGQHLQNKGKITAGKTLSGAATGLQIGAQVGLNPALFAATGGLSALAIPVAAGIGAGIGAITGKKQQNIYNKEKIAMDKLNADNNRLKMQALAYNGDMKKYMSLMQQTVRPTTYMRNGGVLSLALGGTMRRKFSPEEEQDFQISAAIYEDLQGGLDAETIAVKYEADLDMIEDSIEKLNDNNYMKDFQRWFRKFQVQKKIAQKRNKAGQTVFRIGGKLPVKKYAKGATVEKCKSGCSCLPCGDKKAKVLNNIKNYYAAIFRKGGKLELLKESVIVAGPSHEEYNNTGVEKDKGIPVVFNGYKVAEIEGGELVLALNETKEEKINRLRKKAKEGDKKALEELGDLFYSELAKNTYDYTDLMQDA
jgi:hypothetical protein